MDKLTELIQEAKPLYKQRKRRNKIFALIAVLTLPAIFIANAAGLYLEGSEIYVSFDNNKMQTELLQDDFGLLGLN